VKKTKLFSFSPLAESIAAPGEIVCDFLKMDRVNAMHVGFIALHRFQEERGMLPDPGDINHANELYKLALDINTSLGGGTEPFVKEQEMDDNVSTIKRLAMCCKGIISPMCG
jgi:hypothetical protein